MYDFANILFSGPCSARCYFCIGRQVEPNLQSDNLKNYPPLGLERFVELVWAEQIKQVVFTGTNTDPQLYRHEERLLDYLRQVLPADVTYSLHTNGRQALRKQAVFNQYDRVTLSLPSFDPRVYFEMMGVRHPPDLEKILQMSRAPVKISCLVDEHNGPDLGDFLAQCQKLGVKRLVLRKLYGETRSMDSWLSMAMPGVEPAGDYRGSPIYFLNGMEVTVWNFADSQCRSLNLFADGTLSDQYLLTRPAWSGEAGHRQKTLSSWTASAPASSMA